MAIHRIADGRLVEHWSQIGLIGLLQMLGVVPTFGQDAPAAAHLSGVVDAAGERG
jgi:hypothetical protein